MSFVDVALRLTGDDSPRLFLSRVGPASVLQQSSCWPEYLCIAVKNFFMVGIVSGGLSPGHVELTDASVPECSAPNVLLLPATASRSKGSVRRRAVRVDVFDTWKTLSAHVFEPKGMHMSSDVVSL